MGIVKEVNGRMQHVYEGFLYGNYNSRGGACFIESESREEADERYAIFHGVDEWAEPHERAESKKTLCDDDFIEAAVIFSDTEVENDTDLEGNEELAGKLWTNSPTPWDVGEDYPELIEFYFTDRKPKEGWKESGFGEDAYGLIFKAK